MQLNPAPVHTIHYRNEKLANNGALRDIKMTSSDRAAIGSVDICVVCSTLYKVLSALRNLVILHPSLFTVQSKWYCFLHRLHY